MMAKKDFLQVNKQEAIKLLREMSKESFKLAKTHAVYIDSIVEVANEIHEHQKVVVPKFVVDCIEIHKEPFSDASAIDMYDNLYHDVWLLVNAHNYDSINDWHEGYTIEHMEVE